MISNKLLPKITDSKARYNTRIAYMLAVCIEQKWDLISWKKSYIPTNSICVICECRLYEGKEITQVPQDVFKAWYLSPEHYAQYQALLKLIKLKFF